MSAPAAGALPTPLPPPITTPRPVRGRRSPVPAVAVAVLLLAASTALALQGDAHAPLASRLTLPWYVLVPFYLAASTMSLEFKRRESNVCVVLVELPLALGVVLVAPGWHLLARLLASALLSAGRRVGPVKALANLAFGAVEVSAAVVAVTVVPGVERAGPRLWCALLGGLVVGELLSMLALHLVLRLLGRTVTRQQVLETVGVTVVTSTVWTGVAIVTIASALVSQSTLLVVLGLSGAFALFYRSHRRVTLQQRATEDLYAFVKDLGPVQVDDPAALQALEHVRELLHAEHLELSLQDERGDGQRRLAVHLEGEPEVGTGPPSARAVPRMGMHDDCMVTPLLADGAVVGLLTARQRVGTNQGFDMRDLRLLETVATELATALDRGRLLRDLGLAATTDPLTRLPNLRHTTAGLDALLGGPGGVLLAVVAVDSFREVNDTLGHQVGDDLLREVCRRLVEAVPEALVGRVGGARFAVALPVPVTGPDRETRDLALFGLTLRSRVEGPAHVDGVGTHVRLSLGCARAPEDGTDAATLLRRAETAMYSARRTHGGPVLWEPAYEVEGQRRLATVMALREALSSGAIGVAFQPKVDSADGRVCGVEALARWTHPALGVVDPEEFVPLATAAGLIGDLTTTVLRQALASCAGWQRQHGDVGVAVNVSADTLQDAGFVTQVARLLGEAHVPASLLTLELTEDVVVADPQLAAERMHELQALGVHLSIDDFGTGYSSLTYLKGLPIDEVKIDKGFTTGLVDDPGDQAVVRAVVDIAHTLGLRVVAEGVEHEAQLALLQRMGVDETQGFLHSRPVPAREMATWLDRRQGKAGRLTQT